MLPAVRPAVLLAVTALCVAAASRDASPLRSLRTEEGNIDALISRIAQRQQQKHQPHQQHQQHQPHQQHQQHQPHQPPPSAGRPPGTARVAASHPPRRFAYYPSDPEYHAPRAPEEAATPRTPGEAATPRTPGEAATQRAESVRPAHVRVQKASKQPAAGSPSVVTESPAAPAVTSGDAAVTARYRGDPEEVSHDPARHKRPSDDTQVLQVQADALLAPAPNRDNLSDVYFIVTVAGVCAMAVMVTVAGGFCYHRIQRRSKAAGDAEYPAYGVTGPSRDLSPSGDRKLAQSAQMYHYQHQKQQMMAMEKTHNGRHGSASDVDSEEENEEGDYTVYECPGLAPTGEMEVKNPLFQDDQTPAPPAAADTNGK